MMYPGYAFKRTGACANPFCDTIVERRRVFCMTCRARLQTHRKLSRKLDRRIERGDTRERDHTFTALVNDCIHYLMDWWHEYGRPIAAARVAAREERLSQMP